MSAIQAATVQSWLNSVCLEPSLTACIIQKHILWLVLLDDTCDLLPTLFPHSRHIPFYFPLQCLPFHHSLSFSVSQWCVFLCLASSGVNNTLLNGVGSYQLLQTFTHSPLPLRITRDSCARVLVSLCLYILFSCCYLEGQGQCLEEHQPLNDKMADGRPGPDLVKQEYNGGECLN